MKHRSTFRVRVRAATRAIGRRAERLLLPPTHGWRGRARPDDYRRVVSLVAGLAVGFFFPSLVIAGVPTGLWVPFGLAAAGAGVVISSSFFFAPNGSPLAIGLALLNAVIVAALAVLYDGYYHEVGLLYVLVVAAHSIVHGFRAAFGAAVLGTFLVPLVIQQSMGINATDLVYSAIYLFGAALIPWTASRLAERRAVAIQEQLARTVSVEREAVLILARAAEARDEMTGEHIGRVGDLSAQLAQLVGLEESVADEIGYAAMLHDVGKLHVPDHILLKPGPLTKVELAIVRRHTVLGERILGETSGFALARLIARSHHENWDGSGYPDGLAGEAIPLAARIVRLVDVCDALANHRPYKPAWPIDRVMTELRNQRGRQFDPALLDLFEATLERQLRLARPGTVLVGHGVSETLAKAKLAG